MRGLILPFVLILTACSSEVKKISVHFDFSGLIDRQIQQLSQGGRVLDKSAYVNGHRSDTAFVPDAKAWESELGLFRDLEIINKPGYGETYTMERILDSRSNLTIRQFSSNATTIPLIRIYYLDSLHRPKKIEAVVSDANMLFSSGRKLVMEFDEENARPLVIRYSVEGFQKLVLRDTVHYSVSGAVNW